MLNASSVVTYTFSTQCYYAKWLFTVRGLRGKAESLVGTSICYWWYLARCKVEENPLRAGIGRCLVGCVIWAEVGSGKLCRKATIRSPKKWNGKTHPMPMQQAETWRWVTGLRRRCTTFPSWKSASTCPFPCSASRPWGHSAGSYTGKLCRPCVLIASAQYSE